MRPVTIQRRDDGAVRTRSRLLGRYVLSVPAGGGSGPADPSAEETTHPDVRRGWPGVEASPDGDADEEGTRVG